VRTGELMARLMSDIGEVDGLLVRAIGPLLALGGISLVGVIAAGIIYPPAALLLGVLALVIGAGVPWLTVRGAGDQERDRALHRAQLRAQSFEGLEGAADLTALQAREHWNLRVLVAAKQLKSRDRRRRVRLIGGNALHGVCAAAGLVAMVWVALRGFERGAIDAALAAGLVFLTVALLELWAAIGLAWQSWLSGRVAAVRLEQIVDQPAGVAEPANPVPVPTEPATLSVEHVAFRWPGQERALLDGLQLQLRPGDRIAIQGDSGCGKTTLSSLLLRLWDPGAGYVRYGGVDIRQFAQADWHHQVAWLPQNAPVFAGSVADNLRLGDPQATDAQLWQVLADVRLRAWAEQIGGLQAWVGENGATMSAGQARRLALARALLRGSPILLLDEPTEGLDVDTAHALLHDMVETLGSRSLVMITHDVLPEGIVHRSYRLRDGKLG